MELFLTLHSKSIGSKTFAAIKVSTRVKDFYQISVSV